MIMYFTRLYIRRIACVLAMCGSAASRLYSCVLLLLCVVGCAGQEYPMKHYTTDDGLPSNKVYSVYRDTRGFIWVATDKGVARSNGIRFEIFTTFNGLPDNEIFFFQEDKYDRLWLATFNGELCYFKSDTFHTAANTPLLRLPFKAPFIRSITPQADSSVNISFVTSGSFVNITGNKLSIINIEKLKLHGSESKLLERVKVTNNRFALRCTDEVLEADTLGNVLSSTPVMVKDDPGFWQNAFSQNQRNVISSHYMLTTNYDIIAPLPDSFRRKYLLHIVYRNALGHFLTTDNGIFLNDTLHLLRGNDVSCLTQDNEGNYWASTLDQGIYLFPRNFLLTRLHPDAYSGKILYTRALGDKVYYVTSENSINIIDDKRINKIFDFSGMAKGKPKESNSTFFYIDSSAGFYYTDIREGFRISNLAARPLVTTGFHTNLVPSNVFKNGIAVGSSIYANAGYRVLRADYSAAVDGKPPAFTEINTASEGEKIFSFCQAADRTLWYATVSSMYKIVSDKPVLQIQFAGMPFKTFDFFGDCMIGYTHYNKLYVCKNYNGTPEIKEITGHNCIWDKFYKLDGNHVLISTNNYYRMLTISTGEVSVIENPFIPLQADAVCSDAVNCFFFKNGAITTMDIRSVLTRPGPPFLYLRYFTTSARSYAISGPLVVPFEPSKNSHLYYAALAFNCNKVQYQYAVSKDDNDVWMDATPDEIALIKIGYGRFKVKVRAKTVSSAWCVPAVMWLERERPYWATVWFYALLSVALIVLLVASSIITQRLVLRVVTRRHQQVELELKSVYSQLNPHFIFNSLNAALFLVKTNRLDDAYQHIYKFSSLLRSYIKSSRNRSIKLSAEIVNLRNYIELQQVRFNNRFEYEIIIEPGVDTSCSIPSLLLQPLVENAIIHGLLNKEDKGHLKLAFAYRNAERELVCIIEDDGIGREAARLKTEENALKEESFGGELITELIALVNRSGIMKIDIAYTDKQLPETGTIVKLLIKEIKEIKQT